MSLALVGIIGIVVLLLIMFFLGMPVGFAMDQAQLGEHYRQLQQELHPDRYAGASAQEAKRYYRWAAGKMPPASWPSWTS